MIDEMADRDAGEACGAWRSLALDEIATLEAAGCTAEDWTRVLVAEDFSPEALRRVAFYGDVCIGAQEGRVEVEEGFFRRAGISDAVLRDCNIGADCLIEHIGGYISRTDIGEGAYISNVGRITADDTATFAEGNRIAVLSEAGDGNITISSRLTSQMAALMLVRSEEWGVRSGSHYDSASAHSPFLPLPSSLSGPHSQLGFHCKITNCRELSNVRVGDYCELSGASRLYDCTVLPDAYVGADTIIEGSIIAAGASVTTGAKVINCFVGEACHIGKGFSAESSVFFANSYMDNGEACAAFCGPFTVSHHKSTLLIGGQYSFYNAGSGTNYSNHAYKLGPIHYGTLARGSKTASGAHLLLPAEIGAFTMCMGKIATHPDTRALPFSYIIGDGRTTIAIPGRNFATVGTWRDISKWPSRDMRPQGQRRSIVNYDWLSPCTIGACLEGLRRLEAGEEFVGVELSPKHREEAIATYRQIIDIFLAREVERHGTALPATGTGVGKWLDLAGLLAPASDIDELIDTAATYDEAEARLARIDSRYDAACWAFAYHTALHIYNVEMLTDDDAARIIEKGRQARRHWLDDIAADAEKEAAMPDTDPEAVEKFIASLR